MFGKLMKFEFKRLLKNPKTIVVILVFLFVLAVYLTFNTYMNSRYASGRIAEYETNTRLVSLEHTYYLEQAKRRGNEDEPEVASILELLKDDTYYSSQQLVFAKWTGANGKRDGSRWYDELLATIKREETILNAIGNPSLPDRYRNKYTAAELIRSIEKNQYLYDNVIHPVYTPYDATGWQFLYKVVTALFPLIAPVLLILLCSDCMAAEADMGSFKFLLLQPISRIKVLATKALTSFLLVLGVTVSVVAVVFLVTCGINGIGEPRYPVDWAYTYDNESFMENDFSSTYDFRIDIPVDFNQNITQDMAVQGSKEKEIVESGVKSFVAVSEYIIKFIPYLILYLLFLTAFAVLVSTVAGSSIAALTVTICVILVSFTMQLYIAPGILVWNPFAYSDVNMVILETGGRGYLYPAGLAIVLFIINMIYFKKKDIYC